MTPTLTLFVEAWLCTAKPFGRPSALRCETPSSPPEGGAGLPWGGPAGGL